MKRNYYIVGGLVVAVTLIIAFMVRNKRPASDTISVEPETVAFADLETGGKATVTSTQTSTDQTAAKPSGIVTPKVAPNSATEAYVNARDIYQDSGFYFQFLNCHGLPGSLTMKKGTKFMLDNRDNITRKIVIDKKTYTLGAYGFAIATAPLKTGTYYITCNGGGAASVSVQQ